MKYTSPWELDPSLDEKLIAWRGQGASFSEISARLGVTRNSAIGRARRLGLAAVKQTHRERRAVQEKSESPPDPEPDPMPEAIHTSPMRLIDTLNALRECRWPVDSDREPMCCGAPTVEGTSWCRVHLKRTFAGKNRDGAEDRKLRG